MTVLKRVSAHPQLAAFIDLEPASDDFRADVIQGLSQPTKQVAPKYFYDRRGAELFDAICRTPEYYVTRTELALMDEIASDLAAHIEPGSTILEYGAGSGWKTRKLLAAVAPAAYVAVDISRDYLLTSTGELAASFPDVAVTAVCGDFHDLAVLPTGTWQEGARRVAYMPGSTIGNFDPDHAKAFLAEARGHVGAGGAFLIGVDRKKAPERLHAAYNDAQGVTAAFNLNLLDRMSAELGAVLDAGSFDHYAFYNPVPGRIEMHLVARKATEIVVDGERYRFAEGETLYTENSYKYSSADVAALAQDAGWRVQAEWTDADALFGLYLLTT